MTPGKRRPKGSRAQLRPADTIEIRQFRLERQRRRWISLALIGLAVASSAAVIYGAGPPFTFRPGQRATRDIRVKVAEFRRPNPMKTSSLREAAARQVPPILTNSPGAIQELQKQLEDLVDSIASAPRPSIDALPVETVRAWDLDEATFEDLRTASDTPERRDELHRRIGRAFEPITRHGVLAVGSLPLDDDSSTQLEVRTNGESTVVPRDRVFPERLQRPDGPVARDFEQKIESAELGKALFRIVAPRLATNPTLRYEQEETDVARQMARDSVPESYDVHARGKLLVEQGQVINEDQMELLYLEHLEANRELAIADRLERALGILILVAALYLLIGAYIHRYEPRIASSPARLAVLCGVVVAALAIARLLALNPWGAEILPIALAVMTLAVAYNPLFATMVTLGLGAMVCLAVGGGLGHFIILVGGTATGTLLLREVRSRTKPILVGAVAALSYAALTAAAGLWQDQPLELVASDSAWRAGWGLLSGFLLGGSLPFIESAFGIVTGMSLLELGDANHPLLQELVRRAPGTHNHSLSVGAIAEAAAEKVGADPLLVRIGAYFHDIGKMLKPHYFVENQVAGVNRHANLAPAMSTLIIIGHVKDGADLARQHHLPDPIIDLIEQHHGTTLVEYFYHEAHRRRDGNPDAAEIQESAFRYPGPRPQSKEAAILMVSDAVESASRTLNEPTPARIEGLVSELIDKRLRDGQFDECDLTLREIATIRESLIKSLIGIYHGRIKYPEQRTA